MDAEKSKKTPLVSFLFVTPRIVRQQVTLGNGGFRRLALWCVIASCSLFSSDWAVGEPWKPAGRSNQLLMVAATQNDEFPAPDFSALTPYYEVVRYNYDIAGAKLNILLKPKVMNRPAFKIRFYDEDGVQVVNETFLVGVSIFTEVGEPEKAFAYTPSEAIMERVKKVVFLRSKT